MHELKLIDIRQDIRDFTDELTRLMKLFEKRLEKVIENSEGGNQNGKQTRRD